VTLWFALRDHDRSVQQEFPAGFAGSAFNVRGLDRSVAAIAEGGHQQCLSLSCEGQRQ